MVPPCSSFLFSDSFVRQGKWRYAALHFSQRVAPRQKMTDQSRRVGGGKKWEMRCKTNGQKRQSRSHFQNSVSGCLFKSRLACKRVRQVRNPITVLCLLALGERLASFLVISLSLSPLYCTTPRPVPHLSDFPSFPIAQTSSSSSFSSSSSARFR